jgi:P4 family phage/plasmid primase-like protien
VVATKSTVVELIQYTLGEYFDTLPNTVLTKKQGNASSATPEMANKRGKRFVVFQEPEDDDKIYVGYMKQLTGGDWVMARPLFKEPFRFKPQFKLLLTCNKLPHIPSGDGGTWRRLRVTPWESEFIDGEPKNDHQFKKDYDLNEKLESWKQAFMWILVNKYYPDYIKNGISEPKKVTMFTDKYKRDSDVYHEFLSQHVVPGVITDSISIIALYETFKTWYKESYNKGSAPAKKEFIEYLTNKDYNMKNGKIYCIKTTDDQDGEDFEMPDL